MAELQKKATKAKLLWVATTPVPTDPPPQAGKSCVLLPGRGATLITSALWLSKVVIAVELSTSHRMQVLSPELVRIRDPPSMKRQHER